MKNPAAQNDDISVAADDDQDELFASTTVAQEKKSANKREQKLVSKMTEGKCSMEKLDAQVAPRRTRNLGEDMEMVTIGIKRGRKNRV